MLWTHIEEPTYDIGEMLTNLESRGLMTADSVRKTLAHLIAAWPRFSHTRHPGALSTHKKLCSALLRYPLSSYSEAGAFAFLFGIESPYAESVEESDAPEELTDQIQRLLTCFGVRIAVYLCQYLTFNI